jgi:hypothetical protein
MYTPPALFIARLLLTRCASRGSDDVSVRRLSEDARRGLTRKEVKNASIFLSKKLCYKEPLGNACIKWLPMLYYG